MANVTRKGLRFLEMAEMERILGGEGVPGEGVRPEEGDLTTRCPQTNTCHCPVSINYGRDGFTSCTIIDSYTAICHYYSGETLCATCS